MKKTVQKGIQICVISTQHRADDVRIYRKEIKSLKKIASKIHFIVRQGLSDFSDDKVLYHWLINKPGIFWRIIRNFQAFGKALRVSVDVYHFHDPEFLIFAALLKYLKRTPVIFDMHELYFSAILNRKYLPKWVRRVFWWINIIMERLFLKHMNAIILAEESYLLHYQWHPKVSIIQNYLLAENLLNTRVKKLHNPLQFVYLGGITHVRGIWEMLQLFKLLKNKMLFHFHLIGGVETKTLENKIHQWIEENHLKDNITYYGYLPHSRAIDIMQTCDLGLLFLHPIENNLNILPTKLFEYMGNGLVVLATNFPKWDQINQQVQFGITVDIFNLEREMPRILAFLQDEQKLNKIQKSNIQYIKTHYLWDTQEKKLFQLYHQLTANE